MIRFLSKSRAFSTTSKAVKLNGHGAPASVLSIESEKVPGSVGAKDVLVKIDAFPITSGDIRQIEGYLGTSPAGVPGNEAVATVLKVGAGVSHVSVNDRVVTSKPSLGTWRELAVVEGESVHAVPSSVNTTQAALLGPSTGTALRLLQDFASLKKGDWIVQNAADSVVGSAVVSLAKARGIRTINTVADAEAVEAVKALGGDIVVPSEYLGTAAFKRLVADVPSPRLALNAVGGESATNLARALDQGGVLVTYGGEGRNGVTVPTSTLVTKDLTLRGFSYASWASQASFEDRDAMVRELAALVESGALATPAASEFAFGDFPKALDAALAAHYRSGAGGGPRVVVNI